MYYFSYMISILLLNMMVGWLWYSPLLFGNAWAHAYQFSMVDLKPHPKQVIGSIGNALIIICALAFLINNFNITTLREGVYLGLMSWLIVSASHFSAVLWAKKPLTIFFIDTFYFFVLLIINGLLLTVLSWWKDVKNFSSKSFFI